MQSWKIKPADISHSDEILTLVCKVFCRSSSLHTALGIEEVEYRSYLGGIWSEYLFAGPVPPLLAVSIADEKILGCIIPAPFPAIFSDLKTVPEKIRPINALLKELEDDYLSQNEQPEKSLLVDIAVVDASATNAGIYQQLRVALENNAADAGFEKIFGEISSAIAQKVCVDKFGQRTVAEIAYDKFVFNGRVPFASIATPRSIQLVEGSLAQKIES